MNAPDRYAVCGYPIKHSKSPRIHRLFAEQCRQDLIYSAMEVPPERFFATVTDFITHGGKGLNCTVPLKELAWQFAPEKTPRAELSKAVNTLALRQNGIILGDNTDGAGLVADLTLNHGIVLNGAHILILGAGGASRGIIGPLLEQAPQRLVVANRTVAKALQLEKEFGAYGMLSGCAFTDLANERFDLILNATSASLSNDLPPLPAGVLTDCGCCYDLAYGNEPTAFVRWGRQQQARLSLDGLGMLVEQAAEAFYLWRGIRPVTRSVINLLNTERQSVWQ
ncbi:MAG: shikimate dehydrogenase [Gammaproteobacteria bacterium]